MKNQVLYKMIFESEIFFLLSIQKFFYNVRAAYFQNSTLFRIMSMKICSFLNFPYIYKSVANLQTSLSL